MKPIIATIQPVIASSTQWLPVPTITNAIVAA
jgi:hypothetical protein